MKEQNGSAGIVLMWVNKTLWNNNAVFAVERWGSQLWLYLIIYLRFSYSTLIRELLKLINKVESLF